MRAWLPLQKASYRSLIVSRRLFKQLVEAGYILDPSIKAYEPGGYIPPQPRDKLPPKKIQPTVNHVGPRPRRQFDHRGRAKY